MTITLPAPHVLSLVAWWSLVQVAKAEFAIFAKGMVRALSAKVNVSLPLAAHLLTGNIIEILKCRSARASKTKPSVHIFFRYMNMDNDPRGSFFHRRDIRSLDFRRSFHSLVAFSKRGP